MIAALFVDTGQAKNLINCLVQFMAEDPKYIQDNISKVDREILKN